MPMLTITVVYNLLIAKYNNMNVQTTHMLSLAFKRSSDDDEQYDDNVGGSEYVVHS